MRHEALRIQSRKNIASCWSSRRQNFFRDSNLIFCHRRIAWGRRCVAERVGVSCVWPLCCSQQAPRVGNTQAARCSVHFESHAIQQGQTGRHQSRWRAASRKAQTQQGPARCVCLSWMRCQRIQGRCSMFCSISYVRFCMQAVFGFVELPRHLLKTLPPNVPTFGKSCVHAAGAGCLRRCE